MKPREHRHKVMIRARLRTDGLPVDACIRDVSSKGMMIQSRVAPPRGTYVEVVAGTEAIVGRVVWGSDCRFGILTRDKVRIEMIIGQLRNGRSNGAAAAEPTPVLPAARPGPPQPRQTVAKALEFGALFVFAAAMIATFAVAAFETLASPLETVAAFMSTAQ